MFLQREDPCIHLVHKLQKVLGKFIKVQVIKDAVCLTDIEYHKKDNQLALGL